MASKAASFLSPPLPRRRPPPPRLRLPGGPLPPVAVAVSPPPPPPPPPPPRARRGQRRPPPVAAAVADGKGGEDPPDVAPTAAAPPLYRNPAYANLPPVLRECSDAVYSPASPPPPPPPPRWEDDPPPWLTSGFLGWRAEDDAWWRRHRARELQTLGPTVEGVSPDTRAPRLAPVVWPENEAARAAGRPWFDFAAAEWVGGPTGSGGGDGATPDGCGDPDCTGCCRCVDEWAAVEVEPPPGVRGWRPPPGLRRALRLPPGGWRVVHLGTSSAVPTRKRNVSSTAFLAAPRAPASPPPPPAVPLPPGVVPTATPSPEPWLALVDAGEGTAARVIGARWGTPHALRWLRAIYITHVHGDHLYGLPSLLMTVGLVTAARRRASLRAKAAAMAAGTWDASAEPINGTDDDPVIRIYGPYGVRSFVRAALNTTALVGVRFAISELVPRDGDFGHLGRGWRPNTVGLFDKTDGGGSGKGENGGRAVESSAPPPPHPEEEYVPDIEVDADGLWRVGGWGGGEVVAAPLKHRVPCFGYVFREVVPTEDGGEAAAATSAAGATATAPPAASLSNTPPAAAPSPAVDGEVDEAKARALGVYGRQFSVLRSGRPVTIKATGRVVTPLDVAVEATGGLPAAATPPPTASTAAAAAPATVTPPPPLPPVIPDGRPLRKVILLGDTADSSAIAAASAGADLLVHEATFANALADKAAIAAHSTAAMAGAFARAVGARRLHLTHFSSRYEAWTGGGADGDADGGGEGGLGTAMVVEGAAEATLPRSVVAASPRPPLVEEEEEDDDDAVEDDEDVDAPGGHISSTLVIDEEDEEAAEEGAVGPSSPSSRDGQGASAVGAAGAASAATDSRGGDGWRRHPSDDLYSPSALVREAAATYRGGGRVVAARDYMEVDLLPAEGGWGRGRYGDDAAAAAAV